MQRRGTGKQRLRRLLIVVSTTLLLLAGTAPVALAGPDDGVAKKSMFLDLGGAPVEEIAARVERICASHRDPNQDNYIMNVVLVGVVDQRGYLRADGLRAVLPHVPGGGGETCFDNVFVGPAQPDLSSLPWRSRPDFPQNLEPWCADSPYCGGILTPSWRWDNVDANRRAADFFLAFADIYYPGVRANIHWYVTYEAYFDWLGDNDYSESVRSAYSAYLLEMVRTYHHALIDAGEPAATSSRAVLWSPAYENSYYSHSLQELNHIRDNLRYMFQTIETSAAAEGIAQGVDWFDMQDKLGQTDCFSIECYLGVKQWYDFLSTVNFDYFSFASLRVNMELFSSNQPGPDVNEHMARQNFYEANGIPIGASWELRFWSGPQL
ncbi:MAG: hypothetical protein ACRDWS_09380 [Acidimicrobiia bacterium]